jgi:predicted amidohydrolase YtcJ
MPSRSVDRTGDAKAPSQAGLSSDDLPIGPMVGLHAAIARKGPSGHMRGLEEAVSRELALRMYAADPAHLSWVEKMKGTLEPGKLADMIVFNHDPLTVSTEQILTGVDMTFVSGKRVHQRIS